MYTFDFAISALQLHHCFAYAISVHRSTCFSSL